MITLATLPQATEQEVFEQVANHIIKQGEKSRFPSGMCAYRGENNLQCAAGCLMSDEEYNRELMEDYNWKKLSEDGKVPVEHTAFIRSLQIVHDDFNPELWKERLIDLAKAKQLDYSFLN